MRRFIGPVLTVLFTIAYHYITVLFAITPAVGWIWIFGIIGAYVGGYRASVIAATWAGFYSWYVDGIDPAQLVQRVVIGYLIVCTIGYLRRREREEQDLLDKVLSDDSMRKIQSALDSTRQLKIELGQNEPAMKLVNSIETDLGNTLAISGGFRYMWNEIQAVEKWYRVPRNIVRWRAWNKSKDE